MGNGGETANETAREAEAQSKGRSRKETMERLLSVGTAYSVLASGAYGAYESFAPREALGQEAAETVRVVHAWSTSQRYAAQTQFLKLLYAAYDHGETAVVTLRRAIDEVFAKARTDLGKCLGGNMAADVTTVEILASGALAVTLTYYPEESSALKRYAKVRISYQIGTKRLAGTGTFDPLVRILAWEGFSAQKKGWERIPVPDDMYPTTEKKVAGEDPGSCSYPRWNPKAVRYGFVDRRALEIWYR